MTPKHPKLLIFVGLIAITTLVLIVIAGCTNNSTPTPKPTPPPTQTTVETNFFTGNETCVECHKSETFLHSKSGHSNTLRYMTKPELGEFAPPLGQIPNTGYKISFDGFKYSIGAVHHPELVGDLHLAFGSGKLGMTYVGVSGDALSEAQMSYFPKFKKWYLTPGHVPRPETVLGLTHQGEFPRRCIGCHIITMSPGSLMPEKRFLGVGCESCHGAGGLHVEAMKITKSSDLHMSKLHSLTPKQLNELCAKCHIPTQDTDIQSLTETHRFQPAGIMKSRCYKESGENLSCMTCHDAHNTVDKNTKFYEQVCLKCHSPNASQTNNPKVTGKVCPVNPKEKCIGCHMPPRKAFKDSNVPANFTDHFIHIQKK